MAVPRLDARYRDMAALNTDEACALCAPDAAASKKVRWGSISAELQVNA